MAIGGTKVIQVTNIAPQATKDQMQTLFGYLGKIEDIRLYPTIRDVSCPVQSRICYVKFIESSTVGVAQHMTNTVFIDRALIVIPIPNGEIPDEYFALEMTRNGTIVPGLHASEPNLPPNVINSVVSIGSGEAIITHDPKLESSGLPPYPPLPSNYDTCKIEEIRRTVVIVDIDPSIPSDAYIDFFTPAGEVKYLRQCTRTSDNNFYMLVEFSDQPSIKEVLKMNGTEFNGKPITIVHSTQAIVKPQAKSNEAAQREIEEAMTRVKEAQNLISATIDPVIGMLSKDKRRRSRSRSRGRHRRSRSRSRSRRSRSHQRSRRSRSRSRKRSKSRDRKHHSKSPSRKRSKSRSRRSRTPTKTRKSRSKSRSKSSRSERARYKSKERAKSRDKSKEKERPARVSRDRDDKDRSTRISKERERERSRDRSHAKSKDRDRDLRDSKERRVDKDNIVEIEEKRTSRKLSRSPSRPKYRSRSRDRKRSRSRGRRSRSRGRRRSPSPRRANRRRSRTRSRDRKRDTKHDKRDKRERTPSLPKTVRNYDEEERGYDRSIRKDYSDSYDTDNQRDKDSDAKSDNMDISNSP